LTSIQDIYNAKNDLIRDFVKYKELYEIVEHCTFYEYPDGTKDLYCDNKPLVRFLPLEIKEINEDGRLFVVVNQPYIDLRNNK